MSSRKSAPTARVTVLVSFNGLYRGDVVTAAYDDVIRGWERAGLVKAEVIGSAKGAARQGGAEPDDPGSEPGRTGAARPKGDESGEGTGTG